MKQNYAIHDISLTLTEGMVSYPKDVPYQRRLQRDQQQGDSSLVSMIETTVHVGTHVDAPNHFIKNGYGVDQIPLDHLYGPVFVADCSGTPAVSADILRSIIPPDTQRLLLKTDNSTKLSDSSVVPFQNNYTFLDASGAQFCLEHHIKLVGIDYLSIDKFGSREKSAHNILLGHNLTILEGIVLSKVKQGVYFLACGPLKMADSDGAPCRAVLIENL
ncbi:MAG: cyclase family protein [Planctomycetes bacterium]|nr:cyclase family protein [Planctomycetota bacterium]